MSAKNRQKKLARALQAEIGGSYSGALAMVRARDEEEAEEAAARSACAEVIVRHPVATEAEPNVPFLGGAGAL